MIDRAGTYKYYTVYFTVFSRLCFPVAIESTAWLMLVMLASSSVLLLAVSELEAMSESPAPEVTKSSVVHRSVICQYTFF